MKNIFKNYNIKDGVKNHNEKITKSNHPNNSGRKNIQMKTAKNLIPEL
jgi:hypothetical protein